MARKVTPETELKRSIKDFLGWNGAHVHHNFQSLGSYPGIPDLTAFYNQRVWFIEAKAGKGTLSDNQIAFKEKCEEYNIPFIEARSIEDVAQAMGIRV